jgi:isopenicillin N synthase-like dioxygenase
MPSVSQLAPAFPEYLPTAGLTVIDFDALLQNDAKEIERLYSACREKGFFYLKNHTVNAERAFEFGNELYNIPLEDKEACAMGDGVNYLGYKRIGEIVVDSKGTPDSQETWNVWVSACQSDGLVFKGRCVWLLDKSTSRPSCRRKK